MQQGSSVFWQKRTNLWPKESFKWRQLQLPWVFVPKILPRESWISCCKKCRVKRGDVQLRALKAVTGWGRADINLLLNALRRFCVLALILEFQSSLNLGAAISSDCIGKRGHFGAAFLLRAKCLCVIINPGVAMAWVSHRPKLWTNSNWFSKAVDVWRLFVFSGVQL